MSSALKQIARNFQNDPARYARVCLGLTLTPDQEKILRLLTVKPYKVLVPAAHAVGKSFCAAVAVLWHYDCFESSITLTTAPTERQLDIVWREIRTLRGPWGDWIGPKAHELRDDPRHFAKGMVANKGESFQGWHEENVLIVFDEAVGIDSIFWEASTTMATRQLCIYNPTDQSSYAYTAERSGNFHVERLPGLTHPNIQAELEGSPPHFPGALRLRHLEEMIGQWSTPISEQPKSTDLEWPPGSGKWFRPSPILESRVMGRWPTLAWNSIWTDALFETCCNSTIPDKGPLQLGIDCARWGDDDTVFHARKGGVSLRHEAHNGWSTDMTTARAKELCRELGAKYKVEPTSIPVAVDDAGAGGGVVDNAGGYNFIGVNGAHKPIDPDLYPNARSELWFVFADEAARGNVSFRHLSQEVKEDLRREMIGVQYQLDYAGRRMVEKKDVTKKRIGRSPDNSDATHLAYYNVAALPDRVAGRIQVA